MVDIAALGLVEVEPVDYEQYQETTGGGGQSYAPPPEGKYTGRVTITDEDFGATKEGFLKVSFKEIEIIGSENGQGVGYKIKYQMPLSAKKYSNREGNSIIDFIRACGLPLRPKSNEEYIAAVKMASGKPFKFQLMWEAYSTNMDPNTIKGETNFPFDPQDPEKRQPWVQDPTDEKKRIFANGKVKYYISAIQKGA